MPERKLSIPNAASKSPGSQSIRLIRPRRARENLKEKIARTGVIATGLRQAYPELRVPLDYGTTFQLLVAVILSAQCTDAAVNKVTPELFRRFPTPDRMASAPLAEIESMIRPLGLFRAKARSLKACAQQLGERFNGQVPGTMEELTTLAGVGRKTANVILGHAFDVPGIIVDTHCKRVSRRLGLTRSEDPVQIERDLSKLLPAEEWTGFSHRLIIHGRRICHARKPDCKACIVERLCPSSSLIWDRPNPRTHAHNRQVHG
ncbi:MAG TPA: endonuclease III [Candidatus Binatia bacterium]